MKPDPIHPNVLKTILISSAVSIAIGFSFGWMMHAANSKLDSIEKDLVVTGNGGKRPPSGNSAPPPAIPPRQFNRGDTNNEPPTGGNLPNGNAKPPESAAKAEQAKWKRLIEVLGLDSTQAKTLEAAITEAEPTPAEGEPLDNAYENSGKKLEAKILSILSEDQAKAFRELQERSLNNQLSSKSMNQYVQELGKLDLDSTQKDKALEVLLKREKEQAAAIPASTRLLLDGSVLPVGELRISDDAFNLLRKLAASTGGGPMGIEEVAAVHKAEMQRKMSQFEGILTPAQLERYQAGIMESSENLDLIAPPK